MPFSPAAAVGVVGAAGLLVAACSASVSVTAPSPSAQAAAACGQWVTALPETVDGQRRRQVEPADALAAAWGDPAIVARCGVSRPAAMRDDSQVVEVDGVAWFAEPLTGGYVFTTYGRVAYVEVTVPDDYAPEFDAVVDLTPAVADTVPEAP